MGTFLFLSYLLGRMDSGGQLSFEFGGKCSFIDSASGLRTSIQL